MQRDRVSGRETEGGKGYGQDMSLRNTEEAEKGENFITLPLLRESVSERK